MVPYLVVGEPRAFQNRFKNDKNASQAEAPPKKVAFRNNFIHQNEANKSKEEESFIKVDLEASEVEKEIERVIAQ